MALTAAGLVGIVAVPAHAALPSGPTTTGLTGSRPSATNLSFPISDRVSAKVDVATGNLFVNTSALSAVGVNGTVPYGFAYNSFGWQTASNSVGNGWSTNLAGAGSIAMTSAGVVLTQADGSTWLFTTGSTTGSYNSPAGLTSTLSSTSTVYTLTDQKSGQVTKFDATTGNPTSVTDKNGNKTVINYSGPDATSIVTNAGPTGARTLNLGYDSTGFLDSQTNGTSTRSVHYTYEGSTGNITAFTDATGKTTGFTYSSGHLTKIVSPTGAETDFAYDSTGKISEVDQLNTSAGSPGTSTTRLSYATGSQTLVAGPDTDTSVAVATGPHTTYDLNATQKLVNKATDPMGRQRSKTYNANSLPLTSTSGASGATGSTTTTGQYNANNGNSLTKATSQGGTSTTATYDSTNPNTAYLPQKITSDTGSGSSDQTLSYDGVGNQLSSSTGSGATLAQATLTYNTSDGTVATATAPGNSTNKTVYGYNTNHQLTSITPATGNSLGSKAFTYDDFGRLKTETDGAGNTTTYTYDNDDRVLTTAFSDSTGTVTDTYDASGHLLTEASAPGTVTNTYDQLGRLTSTVNTAGGGTIGYGYDKASNQTSMTTSYGTWTNTFDASGVLLVTKYPKGTGFNFTDYATDNQGRRTDTFLQANATYTNSTTSTVTLPTIYAGRTTTSYDNNGRVSEVKAVTHVTGSPESTTFDTQYCYNAASTTSCSTTTTSDHSKIQWEKDVTTGQLTKYTYDGSGRVLTATQSGGSSNTTWTYTYNIRGDRQTAVTSGSSSSSQALAYNSADQITNSGYTYDGAGNLTSTPTATYTYNAAEQMTTSKVTATGVVTSYTYAGAAQNAVLSEATPGDHTFNITYGGQDAQSQPEIVKFSSTSGGNTLTGNLFADPTTGQATMLTTSSDIATLYVYDGLANPVGLLTDFAANSISTNYDPYGVGAITGSGNGAGQNPYTFHGGIQDRTSGLVKFGIRWYNPSTGTWTQQDTLDAPLDPANANRYVFTGGDPINGIDPTGKFSCGLEASLGAAAIVAAGAEVAVFSVSLPLTEGLSLIAEAAVAQETAALFAGGVGLVGNAISRC